MIDAKRRRMMLALVVLIAAALAGSIGCGASSQDVAYEDPSAEEWSPWEEQASGEDAAEEDSGGASSIPAGITVHMCGRSVLGGWFDHWGWDYDPGNPVRFGAYRLVYREMDVPPGIVDTAVETAREVGDAGGGIMFFKLCFADFVGGDEDSARENLESNQRMVRDVVEAAMEEEGLMLILGNALPVVEEYSDEWMVWNQREYNRFLEELADGYGGRVLVLDLYGVLSAPDGSLRPEYAADPYDSHLNDAAYDALDGELAKILQ